MDTPVCVKCKSRDDMVEQDSGLTYTSWICTKCKVPRTMKNLFGKALPFLSLGAIIIGLPDTPDVPS